MAPSLVPCQAILSQPGSEAYRRSYPFDDFHDHSDADGEREQRDVPAPVPGRRLDRSRPMAPRTMASEANPKARRKPTIWIEPSSTASTPHATPDLAKLLESVFERSSGITPGPDGPAGNPPSAEESPGLRERVQMASRAHHRNAFLTHRDFTLRASRRENRSSRSEQPARVRRRSSPEKGQHLR